VQSIIDDTHAMFVGMVAERRKLSPEEAARVADGRVFTGRQAKELKLVDALGGEDTARGWLASERGIDRSLPVRDVKVSREDELWRDLTSRIAAVVMGKSYLPERLTLDGLVALWHPEFGSR
jgi:protease-4